MGTVILVPKVHVITVVALTCILASIVITLFRAIILRPRAIAKVRASSNAAVEPSN